jgi:N-acetylneuraminate synthase/N,N'-diacetyllegionaminate synthase
MAAAALLVYAGAVSGSFAIGDISVGPRHPCFVIAEVGVNHMGDLAVAHKLIDAAVASGANAVKFQTFVPELLAARGAPKAEYQSIGDRSDDQLAMLERLALGPEAHAELQLHAADVGVLFLSSPFDEPSVDLLDRLGVLAFKIPSGEVTNHRLLRRVAACRRPILMSTGMCTLDEVAAAVATLGSAPLALLHCVSSYPAEPQDCNLRAIDSLRARFGVPVGWSDHTQGIAVAIAAVARGADLIEKHVTLRRDLPGPDHAASLEPSELRTLVDSVRAVDVALGDGDKRPTAAERKIAAVARKSLHWRSDLVAGHTVGDSDLGALRPGTGISPARVGEMVGRRLRCAVAAGALVREDDFE